MLAPPAAAAADPYCRVHGRCKNGVKGVTRGREGAVVRCVESAGRDDFFMLSGALSLN